MAAIVIATVTIVCLELHCIRSHLAFFVWNDFGNSDILALDSRKCTAMAGEPRTATTARGSTSTAVEVPLNAEQEARLQDVVQLWSELVQLHRTAIVGFRAASIAFAEAEVLIIL